MRPGFNPATNLFQVSRRRDERRVRKFCALEQERAEAVAGNLIGQMDAHGDVIAALVCSGNLPREVGDILDWRGVSYARIVPNNKGAPDDPDEYIHLVRGGKMEFEEWVTKVTYKTQQPADWDEYWWYGQHTRLTEGLQRGG